MKLKFKWLVIAIAVLACTPAAAAQSVSAPDLKHYDGSKSDRVVEANLHMAVGISSLIQNYGEALPGMSDFLLSPGCLLRPGIDVRFDIRKSLGLATGLDFTINNSRLGMTLVDSDNGTINSMYVQNHFYDITVPVYASVRLNVAHRVKWNIDLGAYISYGLGGKTRASGYVSGQNSLGQPVITHASYKNDYFDSEFAYINGVRRTDWGPRFATGIVYHGHFTLNMVLQVSAPNLAINHGVLDTRYRNISLAFQIGYNFY